MHKQKLCQSRRSLDADEAMDETNAIEANCLAQFEIAGCRCWALPQTRVKDLALGAICAVKPIGQCQVTGLLDVEGTTYVVLGKCGTVDSPGAERCGEMPDPCETLTERETQIAVLVSRGKINKQIAYQLKISENTVATYMRRIFCKLGVSSRAAMVARLMEHAQSIGSTEK